MRSADQNITSPPCEEEAGTAPIRARVIAVAEAAFMADGFHATTMDAIARGAGCSKKTIYKLFASKEDLFFALLERMKDEVCQVLVDRSKPPEAALIEFLEESGRFILRESAVATLRMLLAEYTRSPALLAAAEGRGVGTARLALEGYLEELERSGRYEFGNPGDASRMLMGMAVGAFHHEMLIGVTPSVPSEVLRDRIVRSVRIYLRGTARPEMGEG